MKHSKKTLFDFHGVYFIALQVVKCIKASQIPKTVIYQMPSAERGFRFFYILRDIHLK